MTALGETGWQTARMSGGPGATRAGTGNPMLAWISITREIPIESVASGAVSAANAARIQFVSGSWRTGIFASSTIRGAVG